MRIKRGITGHAKHKRLLATTKGYRMTKNRLARMAKEAYLHAGEYAFRGRKQRKRDMRNLWITKISQAVKLEGLSYNIFINKLKTAKIVLDRKMLANLVVNHPESFKSLVDKVKA